MLPAPHRLRRRRDFDVATRRGRRRAASTVVVHLAAPARTADAAVTPARVGFVVSKACGGAVVRNRVRRRLRHVVAARLPQLPPGSLLVVRALPGAATAGSAVLDADLTRCLERLHEPVPAPAGAVAGATAEDVRG